MGICVVVMGVSAVGKSTVGRALADRLGVPFRDADDLHPEVNRRKMTSGVALDDLDRGPWLDLVGAEIESANTGIVMACSALKRAYRDRIRAVAPSTVFLHLHGSPELLAVRAASRTGHFMPPSLLASQLATLESLAPDEAGSTIDVSGGRSQIVERALIALRPDIEALTPRS